MEIKVLEKENQKIVFELDADHTLCNALKDELRNDKDVEIASYTLEHPLVGKPEFHLQAKDPVKSLKEAIKRLDKKNEDFLKAFNKL